MSINLCESAIIVDPQNKDTPKTTSKIDFVKKTGPVVKKVSDKVAKTKKQELALNHLISLLKKNSKFEAKLKQNNLTTDGKVSSTGIIKIEQPNNFYYEIEKPNQVIYISNGTTLWQYDKALMQVIKKKIDPSIVSTKIPLLIITNPNKELLKYFSIEETQPNIFILTTITKDDFIHQILIGFDNNKEAKINQFQVVNTLHQKTEILFSDVKFVKSFPMDLFNFKAPKGVDILS